MLLAFFNMLLIVRLYNDRRRPSQSPTFQLNGHSACFVHTRRCAANKSSLSSWWGHARRVSLIKPPVALRSPAAVLRFASSRMWDAVLFWCRDRRALFDEAPYGSLCCFPVMAALTRTLRDTWGIQERCRVNSGDNVDGMLEKKTINPVSSSNKWKRLELDLDFLKIVFKCLHIKRLDCIW